MRPAIRSRLDLAAAAPARGRSLARLSARRLGIALLDALAHHRRRQPLLALLGRSRLAVAACTAAVADSARCIATACTEAGDTIVADSCLGYPASIGCDECDEHKCTAGCPYSMCRAGALTSTNWYDESGCINDEWSRADDGALLVHVQYSDDS